MMDEIEKAENSLHASQEKHKREQEKTVAEQLKEAENVIEKKEPLHHSFLVESPVYRSMEERLKQVSARIKKAINEGEPILVKHHADADGYCAGIALEKAIFPLVLKKYGPDSWKYFQRDPSKAPYYDYQDALRDIGKMLENQRRFRVPSPLVLVLDNGSGEEDLQSVRKLQLYGCEIVVLDHHFPTILEEDVDYHINPYFYSGNKNITSTMLAVELARMINTSVKDIQFFPAISGMADKSEGKEFDAYLKLAEMYRLDKEMLQKIALCIDFEAFYIRANDSNIVSDLLAISHEKWQELVDLTYKEAKKRMDERLASLLHYAVTEDHKNMKIAVIDAGSLLPSYDFPATGKSVGLLHKALVEEYDDVVTLGYTDSSVTIRSTKPFILTMLKELQTSYEYACISGGGHDVAGTLSFAPAAKLEILDAIVKWIKKNL